jgi:hypothetical protein
VLTYILPLVDLKWQGAVKTGVAILAATFNTAWPIILGVSSGLPVSSTVIALAVISWFNVVAVQIGVDIRTTTSDLLPVDPTPINTGANQIIQPQPEPEPLPALIQWQQLEADATQAYSYEPDPIPTEVNPAQETEEPAQTSTINIQNLVADPS